MWETRMTVCQITLQTGVDIDFSNLVSFIKLWT